MDKHKIFNFEVQETLLRMYMQIYVSSLKKELKSFTYYAFDQAIESLSKKGLLEKMERRDIKERAWNYLTERIRKDQENKPEKFIENVLLTLAESKAGEVNGLLFNFTSSLEDAKELVVTQAFDSFEYLICVLGINFMRDCLSKF